MPRIELSSPVRGIRGKFANSDIVYFMRGAIAFARAAADVFNPQTDDQVKVRAYFSNATKNWDTLTDTQRKAWEDYAKTYFNTGPNGEVIETNGVSMYAKANSIRQILGLTMISAAPTAAPPSPVTGVAQAGVSNTDELDINVTHAYSSLTGYQVIVRMTPPMATVARKPRPSEMRLVKGVSPGSALALAASGATYTFIPTKYLVSDGQRYGVEVKIVRTADGIESTPFYGDFIKVEP